MPVPAAGNTVGGAEDASVPRPRLLAALADAAERTVLVCAPPGFGKTSLLVDWVRTATPATPTAWADVSPARDGPLWPVVLAALSSCPAVPPGSAVHALAGGATAARSAPAADVVRALDVLPVRVTLVLHDVHGLGPAGLADLDALVAARPAGIRLVLCSRSDTPGALSSLRSAGLLGEVRADLLRFSTDETHDLLRRLDLHLTAGQVRDIRARTGGWPLGVRLVGAALRGGADAAPFLERLAATDRSVGDFLVGEVLAGLPAPDRDLLVAVGPEPAGVDDAVVRSGRRDAGEALDRLARESRLVGREPGGAYRVLALVAPRPGRGSGGSGARGPRTTGHGDPRTALDDALRGGDPVVLAELVHRSAGVLLVTGDHAVLGEALSRIGERAVAADAWLRACAALVRTEAGSPPVPSDGPGSAAGGVPAPSARAGRLAVLEAAAAVFAALATGDLGGAPGPVDVALSRFDSPEWTALALVGAGGRALLVHRDTARATAALEEAAELARAHGFGHLGMQCLGLLAGVAGIEGDHRSMVVRAAGADEAATAGGWESSPSTAASRWMLAYGALLRSEPVEAHRLAGRALQRGGSALHPRYVHALRAVRGAAAFDAGQRHRGLREMQAARAALGEVRLSDEQTAVLAVLEHSAAVALDLPAAADEVVTWLADRIGARAEVLVMRAWAAQAAGRDRTATALVEPVLDGVATPVLPHTAVEALLVEAGARVVEGDVPAARRALRDALSSGACLDVVRPFATAGGQTRELLADHVVRSGSPEPFAVRALGAGPPRGRGTRDLDDDEVLLLALLPSALSVEEISREQRIAAGDARARLRTLYRKLGASSRRTAVWAARERGLLR